jgi:molybdopterin-synthase adenylyltransferase
MIFSAALPTNIADEAFRHLVRADGQEDLCFALWYPSNGATRFSGLIHSLILPTDGERAIHGNAEFFTNYFERALDLARERNCGLAFMHSHPAPGWQGMSSDDMSTERRFAPTAFGPTGLPLLGMTIGNDGSWSARFWERVAPKTYERKWCDTVRVVGKQVTVTYNDISRPAPNFGEELIRTISAWGRDTQNQLVRLHVGVIGAGSVGTMVAESLARMGIDNIMLMDFDIVKPHNLDRLLHATREDAAKQRPKVKVLERAIKESATSNNFRVQALEWSVVEEDGFRAALDCDVLFSCVDRPWPRNVLNAIAYGHLVPVIDGGIYVETKTNHKMRTAAWRAHAVAPGRKCLECLHQYEPEDVALEQSGWLDDPKYIKDLNPKHRLQSRENVFTFSMSTASFEVLQFLSMVVLPSDFADQGNQLYDFFHGELRTERGSCRGTCLYPNFVALGDRMGINFYGEHTAARLAREERLPSAADNGQRISAGEPMAQRTWIQRTWAKVRAVFQVNRFKE